MEEKDGSAIGGGHGSRHHPPPQDRPEASETAEYKLIRASSPATDRALVEAASDLLHRQWPRGGSPEQYRQRCFACASSAEPFKENGPGATETRGLPCSYLLVDASGSRLLAHGRLTECHDDSGAGRAAAATYVVVQPSLRGHGVGRCLMRRLENEALCLGYQYLYLWTQTAVGFYGALGYRACHRASLHRDCLKSLRPDQVSGLESALITRIAAAASQNPPPKREGAAAPTSRRSETILLPPEEDGGGGSQDVWMRKRLVEALDPVAVTSEARLEEAQRFVREHYAANRAHLAWEYFLVPLKHHPQVGPSCGLSAIRVVRDRYLVPSKDDDGGPTALLQTAQRLAMSVDGELFDADDLACLAQKACKLDDVRVQSFPSVDEVTAILVEQNGLVILPYDSHPATRLPFLNSGRSAHWGVLVGLVLGFPKKGSHEQFDAQPELTPLRGGSVESSAVAEAVLLVQHGLSRQLSIAPYEHFRSSNGQLTSVDSRKFKVRNLNLCDRVVIVRPNATKKE